MSEKQSTEVTERQKSLLRKARNAIERNPGTYDQTVYGEQTISCRTPACIAGHMVAADSELRERLSEYPADDHTVRTTTAARIQQTAMRGLGLPHHPVLFQATWPIEWRPLGSVTPRHPFNRTRFTPTAVDAVEVLDEIIAGRNPLALTDALHERDPT